MSLLPQFAKLAARRFSASAAAASAAAASGSTPARKVAVLGAAGGIGQPLGLLMKVRRRKKKVKGVNWLFRASSGRRPSRCRKQKAGSGMQDTGLSICLISVSG